MVERLFILDTMSLLALESTALVFNLRIWHNLLFYVTTAEIEIISKNGCRKGLSRKNEVNIDWVGCILGKWNRATITKSRQSRDSYILDIVKSDVLSTVEIVLVVGAHYVITFIDYRSNWTVSNIMQNKCESLRCFKNFEAYYGTQ